MEVHKHPHHVTHKKKWGEYLLEFLMLFLAVFLGFVAENIREHSVEKNREKQYARLLLSDLRTDSMYFVNRTELLESRLKKHALFFHLMTDSATASNKQVINAFLPLFYFYEVRITPGTYNQMKTSGSLRYIENEHLITALEQYYVAMLVRTNIAIDAGHQFYSNIIYPFFLNHIRIQDIDDEGDSVKVVNPVIINRTKETDQQLLNIVGNYGSDQFLQQIRYIEPLIKKNHELISFIKEEYHIK
ncbi:MAG: hypothetical protein ABIO32_03780 [Ferruginibacter sp.]